MKPVDKAVRQMTVYVAGWTLVFSLLMQAVFLVGGWWNLTVLFGNLLGGAAAVSNFFSGLLPINTLLFGILSCQCISNVPSAVLLSHFTTDYASLLPAVNIGGLGTPIASLASLITLKLYLRSREARAGQFLLVFTVANLIGLAVLLAFAIFF